jgi:hypothetical protein
MKTEFAIGESSSNPFFFLKAKRRMIMINKNHLRVIVAWLIAVGSIIIPRFIMKQPVLTSTSLGDIANGINGLQTAIYTAMGIEIAVILTAMKW